MVNGFLELSFELGHGPVKVRSNVKINDGERHSVTAVRHGRRGSIQIDGGRRKIAESKGNTLKMLDAKGNIYIGLYHDIYFQLKLTEYLFYDIF